MRLPELLDAVNVHWQTEGHKHCRPGWLNTACPFCTGNPGLHLGWNLEKEFFRCWRCGFHPTIETLSRLSGRSRSQIIELVREYGGRSKIKFRKETRVPRTKAFKFPTGTGPLKKQHIDYLEKRGFDAGRLVSEWGLLSTGPISVLDKIDYKNRIVIPIDWDGRTVSFQGRSIGKAEPRYKACPQDRELIQHQTILYGRQAMWGKTGICVEGVTDVWRLGPNAAFAVFGIEFSLSQIRQIATSFDRVIVLFDDDPQAQVQAKKLAAALRFSYRIDVSIETINGDPGGLPQKEADYLVKCLMKRMKRAT